MDTEFKTLVFNLMCDLKKKEIEPLGRARIIKEYLDDSKISERELARQLGIGHSTIQDWLLWTEIDGQQYAEFKAGGATDTDIYRSLRSGTLGKKKAIDTALETCISKLAVFKLRPPYSKDTPQLLAKLKRILAVIEKQLCDNNE